MIQLWSNLSFLQVQKVNEAEVKQYYSVDMTIALHDFSNNPVMRLAQNLMLGSDVFTKHMLASYHSRVRAYRDTLSATRDVTPELLEEARKIHRSKKCLIRRVVLRTIG